MQDKIRKIVILQNKILSLGYDVVNKENAPYPGIFCLLAEWIESGEVPIITSAQDEGLLEILYKIKQDKGILAKSHEDGYDVTKIAHELYTELARKRKNEAILRIRREIYKFVSARKLGGIFLAILYRDLGNIITDTSISKLSPLATADLHDLIKHKIIGNKEELIWVFYELSYWPKNKNKWFSSL